MDHELTDLEPRTGGRSSDAEAMEDRGGEMLLHKCCADLGVNMGVAMSIIQWAEENGLNEGRGSRVEGRSAESSRLMASLIKILEYEYHHPGLNQLFAVRYVFNLPLLDDMIGHHNPASFAKATRQTREAVNKEVKAALKYFQLPARRGMRAPEACENMSKARVKQLVGGS